MTVGEPGRDGDDVAVPTTPFDPEVTLAGDTGRQMSYRSWVTILTGVILLPLMVISTLTLPAVLSTKADIAASARIVSADALESTYGIRVTLVAVTAEGGLVDVRFTVTDRTKAAEVLAEHAAMPALFVEGSGAVLSTSHPMAHKVVLVQNGTYFLLYPNSAGAVQPGTPVSIVVDGVRLAAITAQS